MAEAQNGTPDATTKVTTTDNKVQETGSAEAAVDDGLKKFIPTQPMREDQVVNAVNFLSHPKVKGSPIVYRRSFLERKGLTRDEIDEAFRRVPDPPSTTTSSVPQATVQASVAPSPQQQELTTAAPVSTAITNVPRKGARWSQIVLAIGVLSAAGAGAAFVSKKYVLPKLKAWIRHVVFDEQDSAEFKPKAVDLETSKVATAAAEVAAIAKELMAFRMEDRQHMERMLKALETRDYELKTSLNAMAELRMSRNTSPVSNGVANAYKGPLPQGIEDVKLSNGTTGQFYNDRSARPLTAPATAATDAPPTPASYMEVMAMLERGEKPPGIREVNDKPLNPTQVPSTPRLEPKPKPWERGAQTTVQSSEPWWRQRKEDNGVKITEIEDERGSYQWLPPPPPKAKIPGVDAAIRPRPKSPSVNQSASGRYQEYSQTSQEVKIQNMEAGSSYSETHPVVPSYYTGSPSYSGAVQDVKMNPSFTEIVQEVKMSFGETRQDSAVTYSEPSQDVSSQVTGYPEAAPEEEVKISQVQPQNSSPYENFPEAVEDVKVYHPQETSIMMNGNHLEGSSSSTEDKSVPEA